MQWNRCAVSTKAFDLGITNPAGSCSKVDDRIEASWFPADSVSSESAGPGDTHEHGSESGVQFIDPADLAERYLEWSMTSLGRQSSRSAHYPISQGLGQAHLARSAASDHPTPTDLAKNSTLPRLKGPMHSESRSVSLSLVLSSLAPLQYCCNDPVQPGTLSEWPAPFEYDLPSRQ